MKRFLHYLKSHIIVQLVVELLAVGLFIVLTLSQVLQAQNYRYMLNNTYETESSVIDIVNGNITQTLLPIIRFAVEKATSDQLSEMLADYDTRPKQATLKTYYLISSYQFPANTAAVAVVGPDGLLSEYDFVRSWQKGSAMWNENNRDELGEIYDAAMESISDEAVSFPRYLVYTKPSSHPSYPNMKVFHIAVPIVHSGMEFSSVQYILVLTVRMSLFDEALELAQIRQSGDTIAVIADQNDTILYSQEGALLEELGDPLSAVTDQNPGYNILLSRDLRMFGWKICVYLNEDQIRARIHETYQPMQYLSFLLQCSFMALLILFTHHILKPVRKISKAMQRMKNGGRREPIPVEGTNEVWQMIDHYNAMLKRLEEEEEETRKQHQNAIVSMQRAYDAEREALESQINAHFICNTIGVINYDAIDAGDEKVSVLLKKLSNILRYTFERKSQQVFIGQEMAWTEQYLYLQRERFGDLFTYSVEIDPTYDDWPACKLMFQPFVENSILHGFEERRSGGMMITIYGAMSDDGRLCIEIEDNGDGMSDPVRESLEQDIAALMKGEIPPDRKDAAGGGVGIRNVITRMRNFYGPELDVKLETGKGKGTKFTFFLPYPDIAEEQNEDTDSRG